MNAGLLMEYFTVNGWNLTTNIGQADIVLVGSCGFQQMCEDISVRYIEIVNRKKRACAPMVVFGCLPAINSARLAENFNCVALKGNNFSRLDDLIGARVKFTQIEPPHDLKEYEKKYRKCFTRLETLIAKFEVSKFFAGECVSAFGLPTGNQRLLDGYEKVYHIKVADGCREQCSYCAIRFAEGDLCSKPKEKILSELEEGLAAGYRVFNLIGTDVGAWGQDRGTNIAGLLGEMAGRPEEFKILFSDFHPRWLVLYFNELFPIFTSHSEHFGFLGFPIQSGSDRVLRLMRRNYLIAEVEKALRAFQESAPGLQMTTHMQVGFPGETEEDFAQTVGFMKRVRFGRVSLYMYSDRPGTAASTLADKIPGPVIKRRFQAFRREFRPIIG
jgi:tRNA A37 methylthiotransferase MiaB